MTAFAADRHPTTVKGCQARYSEAGPRAEYADSHLGHRGRSSDLHTIVGTQLGNGKRECGEIVDEDALADQLQSGALPAACFDVFGIEPAENDHLLNLPNFLATPHIGASSEETRIDMVQAALRGLTENELVDPANGKGAFKNVKPGDSIEVHWVYSTCDVKPGKTLDACLSDACANPQLRVEAQVFLVVNDPKALDFGSVELVLVRLDPHPEAPSSISPDAYVATFLIRETQLQPVVR